MPDQQRLAVIDLGSNSFRLVVYEARRGADGCLQWHRSDEIYQAVRIAEGAATSGRLGAEPMRRALAALEVFAHFCQANGLAGEQIEAVATSAIRDAANREQFLELAAGCGLPGIRVLSAEREAHYGYLAAVNSTTLDSGHVLELGGGSLQLARVAGRMRVDWGSWPVGAVAMTELFFANGEPVRSGGLQQLRDHIARELSAWAAEQTATAAVLEAHGGPAPPRLPQSPPLSRSPALPVSPAARVAPALPDLHVSTETSPGESLARPEPLESLRSPELAAEQPRLVGIGGSLRNIAAALQRSAGLPVQGVQGCVIEREALAELTGRLASLPAHMRSRIAGIKAARADVILAAAVVVEGVMDLLCERRIEVTEAGLREGILFARMLAGDGPGLLADVRRSGVLNLARRYQPERHQHLHAQHVAMLALSMFDQLQALGLRGVAVAEPVGRLGDGAAESAAPDGRPSGGRPGERLARAGALSSARGGVREERDLLWAACMLHDIGMSVDYDDHHKHGRYLILNGSLPGFSPREVALIAQATRYHRKDMPSPGPLRRLFAAGDRELLDRCSVLLRMAEDMERSRDQIVDRVSFEPVDQGLRLSLEGSGALAVQRWALMRERALFERAFGCKLLIAGAT